ncbi:hypothetical protein EJ06DRAFT_473778 [Trichodelitschia bisporula]|uniref:Ornithine decarboxylase antizyme n=1 Tax=Trichodelitschia bisporula TaxID=703511 RepID=A0A6G1I321_9PEZI|nr:hypothetical protein EJ06DRAFT_473778 [Trichodelitschia bisporula]
MRRNSSKNHDESPANLRTHGANVVASCYIVNSTSAALQGFHYSSTGAGGAEGIPSPPRSPPLAAYAMSNGLSLSPPSKDANRANRGGAVYTITGECERLFCDVLKSVFLGERKMSSDSLVMGAHNHMYTNRHEGSLEDASFSLDLRDSGLSSSHSSLESIARQGSLVEDWLVVWDYAGGARFRGFIACQEDKRALIIFFDEGVVGRDLKPGLMALLELCNISAVDCSQVIFCVDRKFDAETSKYLIRDLGWVGFEPITLAEWTGSDDIISDQWLFLGMET